MGNKFRLTDKMADADISSFVDITGSSTPVARGFLEMTNGDISQAIQLFFENPDLQYNINPPAQPAAGALAADTPTRAPRSGVREDDDGIIHIDSDDDDLLDDESDVVQTVAKNAQEEEDAAMAKRLQEEMYSGDAGGVADVRSPIRSTMETLVAPNPAWGGGFGDEDDVQSDVLDQIRRRRDQQRGRPTSLPSLSTRSIGTR